MKFGFHATMCPAEQYIPLCKAAEDAGYDSFAMADSILYPKESDTEYPYNNDGSREFLDSVPFIEPFSLIPYLAAVTEKIRFTTFVMKLAIRNPVLAAKSATSCAVLSNNRFGWGVGLSPWPEDFAACQEPWKGRGKRMDEMIEIIRGLETGDYFGYQGDHYQLDPVKLCPTPSQRIPILIGGHSEAALKRAARLGDGWMHAGGSFEELKVMIDKINAYRKEYGTESKPFEIHALTAEGFTPDGIKRLEDLGVTEVIIAFRDVYGSEPDTKTVEQKIAEIEGFANHVLAKVR